MKDLDRYLTYMQIMVFQKKMFLNGRWEKSSEIKKSKDHELKGIWGYPV